VDSELHLFGDDSYDVVVLSQTLQQTRRPDEVLRHLARIAPLSILAVPNFAYWRHRAVLAVRGRMPVSRELPYPWYRTPNIHLSTLPDIEDLLAATGLVVERRVPSDVEHRAQPGLRAANLLAVGAVYLVRRARVTRA
jgi:methionine biosynthesis protein MetW